MNRDPRRRRRRDEDLEDEVEEQELDEREPPRRAVPRTARRRWPFRLFLFLLLVGAALWFAPTIVTKTSLFQTALDYGTANMQGKASAGSASLGWFSPVKVNDFVLYDAEKKPVLTVASLETHKSLLSLVTNSSRPGVVRIEKPKLNLVLRENGSNLEDILKPFMEKPATNSSGSGLEVGVDIVEGSAEILNAATGEKWLAENLMVSLRQPADPTQPLDAKIKMTLKPDNGTVAGLLDAELLWKKGAASPAAAATASLGEGKASVKAKQLPLAFLDPLLRRFAGPCSVAGELSADTQYEWKTLGSKNETSHQVQINNLVGEQIAITAPQFLGRDTLRIAQFSVAGQLALDGERCEFKQLAVQSNLARLEANGAVSLANLTNTSVSNAVFAALQQDDFQLTSELDLAQLAQLLPGTLRIREGTQITSGKISASLVSQRKGGRRQWDGKVESQSLAATDQGRQITWDKPIDILLTAYDSPQGPVIERFVCDSSFLRLTAQGTLDQGGLGATGDLTQLATELDRFFDLGDLRLAGKLQADLQWQRRDAETIGGKGEIKLQDFELATKGVRPWQEKMLVVNLSATAVADQSSLKRIETATVQVQSGSDQMQANLVKPVSNPSAKSLWPIQTRVVGDLATWLPRVQVLFPLTGWNVAGGIDLTETGSFSPTEMLVESGQIDINNLRVVGNGLFIDEPVVKLQLQDVSVDLATAKVNSKMLTLASSAIALRADNLAVQPSSTGTSINAAIGFRSDLSRISDWLLDPSQPIMQRFAGRAEGQMRVTLAGDSTDAQFEIDVTDFIVATASSTPSGNAQPGLASPLKTAWQEPKLRLAGKGIYETGKDTFQLSNFSVTGESLSVVASGSVIEPSQRCVVDVKGEIGYDLQILAGMLRPYLGESFEITGREQRPFALKGPVREITMQANANPMSTLASLPSRSVSANPAPQPWLSPELLGQASLGWKTASVYGMPIGVGEVQASLSKRILQIQPIDLQVSQGRIKVSPQVLLDRNPALIVAERGPVLEKVRLSPEICSQWLKYVTPIVADVTQVDGLISLNLLDTAVIPASDPLAGEVRGELAVHSAQIGPGPLAQEILWMANTMRAIIDKRPLDLAGTGQMQWVNLPEQNVPFHWKDRRVYHEGLQMTVKDVVIRTKGSVGIDQSLDMLAEVPIRDEWVQRDRAFGAALQGTSLQIPITGTVSKPKVDRTAFQQFTKQAVTNAAGKLLEDQLNRGLDKLLRPR